MNLYPIADRMTRDECERFGVENVLVPSCQHKTMRTVATGEFRTPKAGEWYLSGAIVEAYRARSDMTTHYYIARLVKTEEVITRRIIKE